VTVARTEERQGWRLVFGPGNWILLIGVVAASGLALWSNSFAGLPMGWWLLSGFLMMGAGFGWLTLLILSVLQRRMAFAIIVPR
jgi:hypothetical protein